MRPSAHSEPGGREYPLPEPLPTVPIGRAFVVVNTLCVSALWYRKQCVCVSIGGGTRSPRPPADVGINHRKQDVHSPHWCASPRVAERNPLRDSSCPQHQPNKFRSKTIQKPSNNPYTYRTPSPTPSSATIQRARVKLRTRSPRSGGPPVNRNAPEKGPKGGAGATPRHTALRRGGEDRRPTRRAAPTPRTPRAAPVPPLATLRYGAAGAAGGLPEGPPQPRRTPRAAPAPPLVTLRHGASARRERPEAYPKGRPYCQKSDPAPPVIGRGSKRDPHPPRRKI